MIAKCIAPHFCTAPFHMPVPACASLCQPVLACASSQLNTYAAKLIPYSLQGSQGEAGPPGSDGTAGVPVS